MKPKGMVDPTAIPPTIHQSELNRLVTQLYHLREALRPFAHFADALPDPSPDGSPRLTDAGPAFAVKNPRNPAGDEHVITFADLRHAKLLLDRLASEDWRRFIAQTERKMVGVSDSCTALNCQKTILGCEPWHLAGFCSEVCAHNALNERPPLTRRKSR